MKISGKERIKKIWTEMNCPGIILMYHRVVKLEHDPWELSVLPERFDEHMRVLKKYGGPVTMREMGKAVNRFTIGQKAVAITFDDGYADNFQNAKPILEKYGIPATFFITTGAIDAHKEFWWDEIGRITLAAKTLPATFQLTIGKTEYRWQVDSKNQEQLTESQAETVGIPENNAILSRIRLHYALWQILSRLSVEEKWVVLRQIAEWAGQPPDPRADHLAMTSEELISLANSKLFEIGAHTVNHPMLSRLPLEHQEEEIIKSKQDLEEKLTQPITSFAYPHGDYSEETIKILKQCKFKNACVVKTERISRNSDPFRLPRFGVWNLSGDEFEKTLRYWLREAK